MKVLQAVIVFMLAVMLSACAVVRSGHDFDEKKVFLIESGKTSADGVVGLFGPPDNILRKPLEGVTAYIYKNMTNSFIGIPIIPGAAIITLGKAKNTGFQLTIMFSEGSDGQLLVSSYELLELNERIFE